MDKVIILAVAGSGKTTHIIQQLNLEKRSLIITYTHSNIKNLKDAILKKFKCFPDNITLMPYFSFLYSFCLRPLLPNNLSVRGISYEENQNRYLKQTNLKYFFDGNKRAYSNRIGKLLKIMNLLDDVNERIVKYYDNMFIDEIQDFAGHDFNLIMSIAKTNIDMMFVGDFYQHTFDTSRDGNTNKYLHNDLDNYKDRFKSSSIKVDSGILNNSYRCSPTVCNFITDNIGIEIYSHKDSATKIEILETLEDADKIFNDKSVVKLFLQKYYEYGCYSKNWGDCKGENKYHNVCVVLNKTTLNLFRKGKLNELKPQTKNKLYVACSRANNDLFFVSDEFYKKYKLKI